MKRVLAVPLAVFFAAACFSAVALAHSGGTDAYGCHWNHKTYTYHCH